MRSLRHQPAAQGKWRDLPTVQQMANIGSEVGRARNWTGKNNREYARMASDRALELLYLTIDDRKNRSRLKELTRLYEVLVDYFYGLNEYRTNPEQLERYFLAFNYAARAAT